MPPSRPPSDTSRAALLLRKAHSLAGVLPVGVFIVCHLWANAKALQGQDAFDGAVQTIWRLPYLPVLELAVLLPLAYHAAYGLTLVVRARYNVGRYPLSRNWMFALQRASGVLALAFIGFHLYGYWLPLRLGRTAAEDLYPMLCAGLSSARAGVPLVGLAYVLGIAACAFHLANGLWGFCVSWGITVSRQAQRAAGVLFGIAGLVVFVLGANTAVYFATGARLALPSSSRTPAAAGSCGGPAGPAHGAASSGGR
ncbi:MAG: succinate dehydrogenase [Deltaproteobacteria bacterium]|nr:succinate dehydrogenase [Deltaproteobacteria bacterium]